MLALPDEYRISDDDGVTWGEPKPLRTQMRCEGLIRLASGALAAWGTRGDHWSTTSNHISLSTDEGKTWSDPVHICNRRDGVSYFHCMVQVSSGRLIFAVYWEGLDGREHPDLPFGRGQGIDEGCYGMYKGHPQQVEGHGHIPEMGISYVWVSDDEGKTWESPLTRKDCLGGGLMGWFDFEGKINGSCGMTPVFEPNVAETSDGRLLLFARSTVGRLVSSYSYDHGSTWYAVRPTELASGQSPPVLIRIPQTGDLLCVWNQVSREEIRRGYKRNRLSAAISKDGGATRENFKTLELSAGMDDVDRVPVEYPIRPTTGLRQVGEFPHGYVQCAYPNVDIAGDKVYVRYYRRWLALGEDGKPKMKYVKDGVLRVYPVAYFYAD